MTSSVCIIALQVQQNNNKPKWSVSVTTLTGQCFIKEEAEKALYIVCFFLSRKPVPNHAACYIINSGSKHCLRQPVDKLKEGRPVHYLRHVHKPCRTIDSQMKSCWRLKRDLNLTSTVIATTNAA